MLPKSQALIKSRSKLKILSEQAATVREIQELQKKQKTLDIIRQNFIALMYTPNVKSDSLQTKRESVPISRDE